LISALRKTLTLILAGGIGKRLYPLTKERAKPAVIFGGIYRIIDFALSNCVNSGLRKIHLLTQYRSHSLQHHIALGWNIFSTGEFIDIIPPQLRGSDSFYRGTADAIYHNIFLLEDERPDHVLILAGDHVYKMNYERFLRYHIEKKADVTVACVKAPLKKARQYGVVAADDNGRIISFLEKPADPPPAPGSKDRAYVSMGIYIFSTKTLVKAVVADAKHETAHDFGHNIIPALVAEGKAVFAYNFLNERQKVEAYWRDIGDLDSYHEANMDLCDVNPVFNLYDDSWPVRTYMDQQPPAKTVFAEEKKGGRRGQALDSLTSPGVIISGGTVRHSILSPNVRINSYAQVEDSIFFHGVDIGRHCRIRRAIIDKDVKVPAKTRIGYDLEKDRRYFTVSPGGVVVIPKGHRFD
jgi:glucose-1-phosphate adenylyltransferase